MPRAILTGLVSGTIAALVITFAPGTNPETPAPPSAFHASALEQTPPFAATPLNQEQWEQFKASRAELLKKTLHLRIPKEVAEDAEWIIPFFDVPQWIIAVQEKNGMKAGIDPQAVEAFLERTITTQIPRAEHVTIHTLPGEEAVHAEITGHVEDGWELVTPIAAQYIAEHVRGGIFDVELPVQREYGMVQNETDMSFGDFALLARGRSNYAGSIPNRAFNVEKAMNEHVNGVLVPPGGSFSFLATLKGPVETDTGWKNAYAIFGEELSLTAGGGICQASTTVYRAALLAGLPIEKHRSHSMYIKYYKKYGEGLDATIYPPYRDLVFQNDTPGHLLVLARTVNEEALVEIYGTPDGRTVSMEGPYRAAEKPHDLYTWRTMENNDIVWRRRIVSVDGEENVEVLLVRYPTLPWRTVEDAGIVEEDITSPIVSTLQTEGSGSEQES